MSDRDRRPPCPNCGKPADRDGNPARPFCSTTCKLIDLGGWLDERFRIPEAETPRDTPPEADDR
ncbi:MAG: DNA gyrase inhibitor YacG [Candidatus Rokuibacteriota bacterium]